MCCCFQPVCLLLSRGCFILTVDRAVTEYPTELTQLTAQTELSTGPWPHILRVVADPADHHVTASEALLPASGAAAAHGARGCKAGFKDRRLLAESFICPCMEDRKVSGGRAASSAWRGAQAETAHYCSSRRRRLLRQESMIGRPVYLPVSCS